MAECLELGCVSAKIMLFPLKLCSCRTVLQKQKLQQQETSQSMLNKHKAQAAIQTQLYIFLTLNTLPNFFHLGALFPDVERNCSKPVTFQLILN